MKLKFFVFSAVPSAVVIVGSLLLSGCATSQDVDRLERQVASNNAALREVKGNLDEINFGIQAANKRSKDSTEQLQAIQKGQGALAESMKLMGEDINTVKRNQADLGSKVFSGGTGSDGTNGRIDELKNDVANTNAKLDALKALLLQKFAETEAGKAAPQGGEKAFTNTTSATGQPSQAAPQAQNVPAGDPNQMYTSAYQEYTKGNYDLALAGFQEYLRNFPDGEYAGNAQYWVGESLYSLGKFQDALKEFDALLAKYPVSSKVPGAMLKRGLCYESLRKPADARKAYDGLIAKYPESEAAKVAQDRIKKGKV
jgi:tol-pal system protein YbgF